MCHNCGKFRRSSGRPPLIAGTIFGLDFEDLPDGTNRNAQFRLYVEDDEFWHPKEFSASVLWLEDLRNVINQAIEHLRKRT